MNKDDIEISVVVPVYKEEANIRPFLQRTEAVLTRMGVSYEIVFSLDPSPDNTEGVILEKINRNPNVKLLVFSRRQSIFQISLIPNWLTALVITFFQVSNCSHWN